MIIFTIAFNLVILCLLGIFIQLAYHGWFFLRNHTQLTAPSLIASIVAMDTHTTT